MNDYLQQSFAVTFHYKVHFTAGLFSANNPLLASFFTQYRTTGGNQKILFVVDEGVVRHHPQLGSQVVDYITGFDGVMHAGILVMPGGEACKNDPALLQQILEAIHQQGIDRHSYLCAIGGGALLDLAGLAAAVAHRGVRHIRVPTTVLSQNDSGIGVKNGINYFGKKNFYGTFAPPAVVLNDEAFLTTLSDRHWRAGMSEAFKVALIKDAAFFDWLEENAGRLAGRDMPAMSYLIRRCAELHLEHIRGGDPFESGSARPLDFGHWSAHKLEQLTEFEVLHGEAVAMGIALDTLYSAVAGHISFDDAQRVVAALQKAGLPVMHPHMHITAGGSPMMAGLEEFREHLGGQLTITLLQAIGRGMEVHQLNQHQLVEASARLQSLHLAFLQQP